MSCLFPLQGNLLNPGIKPESPASAGRFSTTEPPEKPMTLDCAVLCLVTQSCPTLCDPMDYSPPGSSVHGDSPGKNTGVGCQCPPSGDLPNPGIEPRSPALWADSSLSEPPGKHENTGVGSLSLLQGIFPTQESNWGLLHCRRFFPS